MKRYNLKTIKKWINKEGEEMKKYFDVGEMVETDKGSLIITLGVNPNVSIYAFDYEPRPTQKVTQPVETSGYATVPEKPSTAPTKQGGTIDYGDALNPDEIPF